MFVDKAEISVKAGNGGNGAVSFHREKYISAGGPDGGDGGRGGNIILSVDTNMSTLMDFRYKKKYVAPNGVDGSGKNKSGKDGKDLTIRVPDGTVIRDKESGAIIVDMSGTQSFKLARGGNGGWGNTHFATPTRQAPRFSKAGLLGEELSIILELKLLADVGLIGFPNVGKSTLLSVVSKATPKIADYHFTTLFPNLGVVYVGEDSSFVLADIPGIIEGASDGAGLGHDFLRHIDRCRLFIHVVDVSGSEGRDPIADFETINSELSKYNPEVAARQQLVAANKCDIAYDEELLERFCEYVTKQGHKLFKISAATTKGVTELANAAAAELSKLPPIKRFEPDYVPKQKMKGSPEELVIENFDDVWSIEGEWIERLMQNVNFEDYESRMFFNRVLHNAGVYKRLQEMGIRDGDTLSIYNLEFDYES
ncbi:MAG: GTPase ObgE [Oscillospiraceae bacterium]|nr:GTPase ObgE [Oscillospiraceae bacterium]MCL2278964.1 GTPase ObgE [Oscillospiraceae bacterium]